MRRTRWVQALGACLVLLATTPCARATEPAADAAAPRDRALTRAERAERAREQGHLGLAAYSTEHWQEALTHFAEAEAWMHSPVFLLYMAHCHRELGRLSEAGDLYRRVAEEKLPELAPSAWLDAQTSARQALETLDTAGNQPADGAPEAPLDSPKPTTQLKSSNAEPLAEPLPWTDSALEQDDEYPYRTGAYAAFGVGFLGLVSGSILGGIALSKASQIKARCEGTSCLEGDEQKWQRTRRLAHAATGAFIVAGAGAAVGVTLWLLPRSSDHEVAFTLHPDRVSVRGRF